MPTVLTSTSTKFLITIKNNFKHKKIKFVGNKLLIARFATLNKRVELNDLNLSLDSSFEVNYKQKML